MPDRTKIPTKIKNEVLKEFRHRCAICGGNNMPQMHHIDEDPSNHNPMNLIPLCPNCHLSDQHDPTGNVDPGILHLFRKFKDPTILSPPFHAFYRRFSFLLNIDSDVEHITPADNSAFYDLTYFMESLEMGEYYSYHLFRLLADGGRLLEPYFLKTNRDEAITLLIELLRFQNWERTE